MLYNFLKKINQIRKAWADLYKFNNLQASKKRIVFYAETHADWAFLDPVIESLSTINIDVIRITSDIHDNYLNQNN